MAEEPSSAFKISTTTERKRKKTDTSRNSQAIRNTLLGFLIFLKDQDIW